MFDAKGFWANRAFPLVMGIVNATGDSFSEGVASAPGDALERALKQLDDGADMLDVGGESTRPGSIVVPPEQEIERTVPLIEGILSARPDTVISIDTRKAAVARAALEAGAAIVNDVSLLRYDAELIHVTAQHKAGLILAHSRGVPQNMREPEYCSYPDGVCETVLKELLAARSMAISAGVSADAVILDPNFGFAKTAEQDWEMLRRIALFCEKGPVLAGISRKSFLGKFLEQPEPKFRLGGTIAATLHLAAAGVAIVRVHDVRQVKDALRVAAFLKSGGGRQ